ncbi:hypothetical protein Poli38472_001573 [Pythium oligandrum]|uniref:HIT-type domain-containing protein n=1 Tax=Pythium oligandrum TaxID=41045 RepID=A0A8K1CV24_PYTOL|nr:hypothetical protein Poli38472_001573 [Pythium oligandrum]|eukprot:TMW69417.1 hypothetical protein Poli38472_001573 [Pythium oligandrum]
MTDAMLTVTPQSTMEHDKKRVREADTQDAGAVVQVEVEAAPVKCCKCDKSDVKYRCPGCERITCSLACCLAHKKEFECDGKRDRTKYIPLKQFSDSDLSSDFFFLEEVSRSTNSATRSRSQLGVNVRRYGQARPQTKKRRVASVPEPGETMNPHVSSDWLTRFPVAFQLLVQHAAKRGVALTLLAPGMSKRTRNSSYMDTKASKLFWRVEWSFPSAEVAVSLSESRACDSNTPFELLAQYLDQRPDNTSIRGKLKKYTGINWRDHVVVLMRKEFTPASQPQYYPLDGNLSLESNLKRKAVVEFPILTIVLRADLHQYPLANDLIQVVEETIEPSSSQGDDGVHEEDNDRLVEDDEGEEVVEEDTMGALEVIAEASQDTPGEEEDAAMDEL